MSFVLFTNQIILVKRLRTVWSSFCQPKRTDITLKHLYVFTWWPFSRRCISTLTNECKFVWSLAPAGDHVIVIANLWAFDVFTFTVCFWLVRVTDELTNLCQHVFWSHCWTTFLRSSKHRVGSCLLHHLLAWPSNNSILRSSDNRRIFSFAKEHFVRFKWFLAILCDHWVLRHVWQLFRQILAKINWCETLGLASFLFILVTHLLFELLKELLVISHVSLLVLLQ